MTSAKELASEMLWYAVLMEYQSARGQRTPSVDGEALVVRSKAARIRQVRERLLVQQAEHEAAGSPPTGQVVVDFLAERREEEARRLQRLDALFPG
jgi:uncharacterized membrane protein